MAYPRVPTLRSLRQKVLLRRALTYHDRWIPLQPSRPVSYVPPQWHAFTMCLDSLVHFILPALWSISISITPLPLKEPHPRWLGDNALIIGRRRTEFRTVGFQTIYSPVSNTFPSICCILLLLSSASIVSFCRNALELTSLFSKPLPVLQGLGPADLNIFVSPFPTISVKMRRRLHLKSWFTALGF